MKNKTNYFQSIGNQLIKKLYPLPNDIQKKGLKVASFDNIPYLPYKHPVPEIKKIFHEKQHRVLGPNTFGIHWFNGSPISKDYENKLDKGVADKTGPIYKYVKEYEQLI